MKYTWDELWKGIDALNKEAQEASFYKLFLLGRHGHNERKCLLLIPFNSWTLVNGTIDRQHQKAAKEGL